MENAVEALKFACAVMAFTFALTISISSFSSATEAVTSIISMRDRETEYTYVTPTQDLTRTVGVETVIPTMYRAYKENIQVYFFDATGKPLNLYYKTNNEGEQILENGNKVGINYVNLELENFSSIEEATNHLDVLLRKNYVTYKGKYKNQICHEDGLYDFLSQFKFKESLGEYYQGTGTTKNKKRVITYTVQQ